MVDLPECLPHGELQQVFPDVYVVTGQVHVGPGGVLSASRNMTVVREDGELTLVNTVRLNDRGLIELDALGQVRHIVKLGSFHGQNDAFYVHRYPDATLWAPPGMPHDRGVVTDRDLGSGAMPLSDAELFVFATAGNIEAILRRTGPSHAGDPTRYPRRRRPASASSPSPSQARGARSKAALQPQPKVAGRS